MDGDFSYEMEFCFHDPMSRNPFCKSDVGLSDWFNDLDEVKQCLNI